MYCLTCGLKRPNIDVAVLDCIFGIIWQIQCSLSINMNLHKQACGTILPCGTFFCVQSSLVFLECG